jgi:acetolactate synthase I/II/III large subunit
VGGGGWRTTAAAPEPPAPAAAISPAAISPAEVARALDDVLSADDILVEEVTTNSEILRAGVRRTRPGTLFSSGGSGLGWALGAAIGVRLAAPDRRVVAVVGDGSFLFSAPTAALWAAHHEGTPFLTVVLQNGGYAASRRPVFRLFPDGESCRRGDVVGTRFSDPPDFATLARASHAHGEHVGERERLPAALAEALAVVDGGRCALVTVEVTSPWL